MPLLLLCFDVVAAVRFRIRGHSERWLTGGISSDRKPSSAVLTRAFVSGTSGTLINDGDLSYFANLTLNQKAFSVLIDTGSSDLWVGGSVPNSQYTGVNASVTYVSGGASGPVNTADLDFLNYHVPAQAFIVAHGKDDGQGLIGLGPNAGSSIRGALNSGQGNTVIDRIFLQNISTSNFLTILLGRSNDPTDKFPGDITVGEIVQGYENITSQPKLPVTRVPLSNRAGQHWQTFVDENGFVGPDGNSINAPSIVDGGNKLTVIMDSGFSLPQVPRAISDSIYGRIPGAIFKNITSGIGSIWTIPCSFEVNITIKIGGVTFPIHPLDASLDWVDNGQSICIGAFQPQSMRSKTFDAILGMGFLRNAYMLVNYGNFIDGMASQTADPFLQLLPLTTDLADAHADFVRVRLNGVDNTSNQTLLDIITASGPPDPKYTGNSNNGFVATFNRHKWVFIGAIIGVAVLLTGIIIAICCCRQSGWRRWMTGVPVKGRNKAYRPLDEPAPGGNDHYEYTPRG